MYLHQERTGQKFGSTKLVKAMLEPHRVGLDAKANARLDQILTRQDIEAWLNRGVEFSNEKFHFVDYYIQTLLKSENGLKFRNLIEESFTQEMCRILSELYVQEADKHPQIAREFEGLIYSRMSQSGEYTEKHLVATKCSHREILVANVLILKELPSPSLAGDQIMRHGEAYFVRTWASGIGKVDEAAGVVVYRNPELHNRMSRTAKEQGLTILRYSMTSSGLEISFPSESIPFGMDKGFLPRVLEGASVRFEVDVDPDSSNLLRRYAGRVV